MPIILSPAGSGQGSSEFALPGHSKSLPRGVESIFDYNGLVFNDRTWLDTYIIKQIDGLYDADIRDQREVRPETHGEVAFNSYYGGRTIAIQGTVRAWNIKKLRNMCEDLEMAFMELAEKPLRWASNFSDYDAQIYCKKSAPLSMTEVQANNNFTRDFLLTLRASDPRIISASNVIAQSGSPITTPIIVTNEGNFYSNPVYTFTGPLTNLTLLNSTSGMKIKINGTIPAGSSYFIDTLKRTMVDQNGVNKFDQLDISSDWVDLLPGSNTFELTNTSGTTTGNGYQISYFHTWL